MALLAGRGRCARQKDARSAVDANVLREIGIGSEAQVDVPLALNAGSEAQVDVPLALNAGSEADADVPLALSAGSEADGRCARHKEGWSEVEALVPCALSAGSGLGVVVPPGRGWVWPEFLHACEKCLAACGVVCVAFVCGSSGHRLLRCDSNGGGLEVLVTGLDESRCIYCCLRRKRSREHVLPKALGGDLTTLSDGTEQPVVCEVCNGGFSTMDQSIAELSLPAMDRLAWTDGERMQVQMGGEHFHRDPVTGLVLEVRLSNGLRPALLPQLHRFENETRFFFSSIDDRDSFVGLLRKKAATNALATVFIKQATENSGDSPRLVQYRKDALFVRAASEEEGAEFRARVAEKWSRIADQVMATQPPVRESSDGSSDINLTFSICLNENYRAVVKIAFNFLACKLGGKFALSTEFDAIREYIIGNNIFSPAVKPGQISVDTRFIQEVVATPVSDEHESHIVVVYCHASVVRGIVVLYGSSFYDIRLGLVSGVVDFEFGHRFSIDRSGNRAMRPEETFAYIQRWRRK